ncbi:hypothetical protein D041_4160 [Vibrio parahaemolyticus EKP-008]|nr:hypothetical protein D041_4160 [Vibrio parahaemolyticus EKP-008]
MNVELIHQLFHFDRGVQRTLVGLSMNPLGQRQVTTKDQRFWRGQIKAKTQSRVDVFEPLLKGRHSLTVT